MRAVVQRVAEAQATARSSGREDMLGRIGPGLCVLLAVHKNDDERNAEQLVRKISTLRIFEDEQGKLNRSVQAIGGEILVVSQFTLYGECSKGSRPSFSAAAGAAEAERLYEFFIARLRAAGSRVATGRFQAAMKISLVNDGPVTLILDC
jgi:D-tyrosyl-tRNA(Tyr) deacylase